MGPLAGETGARKSVDPEWGKVEAKKPDYAKLVPVDPKNKKTSIRTQTTCVLFSPLFKFDSLTPCFKMRAVQYKTQPERPCQWTIHHRHPFPGETIIIAIRASNRHELTP